MLFATGSRVRFKNTGDEGEVTGRLDDEMVNVRLDDGDEIPAFVEDLERIEDNKRLAQGKKPVKAKVVEGKRIRTEERPETPRAAMQYSILKSMGIQLAFDPVRTPSGTTGHYDMYLINDTPHDVIFTFQLFVFNELQQKINGKLESVALCPLGELPFDQLNDTPRIDIECWRVKTDGTGKQLSRSLKIKPQQFFKKILTAPILNKSVHHYKIFEHLDNKQEKSEDLKSYTQRKARPLGRRHQGRNNHNGTASPEEFAAFNPEIDLHIEKLTDRHHRMNNADILRLQVKHFEDYLEKAIRIGIDRVYIIHGVGKGRLRDAIASRLLQHPDVRTFKNEFHPKYGYGATEVLL
ncbi:MAG: Smr/MutS family protein [Bacteroidota bacterium]